MKNFLKSNPIRKVGALLAATLILPALAHAEDRDRRDQYNDSRWWCERDENNGDDHDADKDRDRKVPVVPETNAGWVLIPFVGAVLLFSSRRLLRAT
jgi:hypothetical protein